ncbi:uncharacterized protein LOC128882660 [Hylaeus volcanicus]|uniref:uncharacterized protein LOC128882660 n=1 Tax=Hylaeus volcanicus TaxID=313075 RepID=UPI0023B8741B|nr:uncharacterized protein LOC128882660 [Hylaeus volcanicus]
MSIKSSNSAPHESSIEAKKKQGNTPYSRLYDNLHSSFTQKNLDKRYRRIDHLITERVDEVRKDELDISKEQILQDSHKAYSYFIENSQNRHRSISSLKPFCNSFNLTRSSNVPAVSSSSSSSHSERNKKSITKKDNPVCPKFKSFFKKWKSQTVKLNAIKEEHCNLIENILHSIFLLDIWRVNTKKILLLHETQPCSLSKQHESNNPDDQNSFYHTFSEDNEINDSSKTSCYTIPKLKFLGKQFASFFFFKLPLQIMPDVSSSIENSNPNSTQRLFKKKKKNVITYSSNMSDFLPSQSPCFPDYIASIKRFKTLCFCDSLKLSDPCCLPDFKQDSKDLLRDTIRVNGCLVPGTYGYKNVYEMLTKLLLPDKYQKTYDNFILHGTVQEPCDRDILSNSNDTSLENFLCEMFHRAEFSALILLHLLNRTLAGGHSFEKVLSTFKNDSYSFVVPNSSDARPLKLVIGQQSDVTAAILASQTSFRVYSVTSNDQDDVSSCLAEVQAYFVTDLNVSQLLSPQKTDILCCLTVLASSKNEDMNYHLSCSYIPPRLESWINSRFDFVKHKYTEHSDNTNFVNYLKKMIDDFIPYRIYITKIES